MFKWILIVVCVVCAMLLISRYTGFLETNIEKYHENTTSLGDAGKIIKDIKGMKQEREEDVRKSEEGL